MKQNKKLILSLESSGSTCGIALSVGKEIVAIYEINEKNLHDKLMAARIESLLKDLGATVQDITAAAVSAGPGSFTGLRIAGSIAKGLCYDDGIKLISVPTMEALARAAASSRAYCPPERIRCMIGSTRGECFLQAFDSQGRPTSDITETTIDEALAGASDKDMLVGPVAPASEFSTLSVRYIASLAAEFYENSQFTPSAEYAPLYVQDFKLRTAAK
ncbi:MAG: tRNA (adenosine(37)-N6)-threonylcarbamoyltransferase complex dimerization subunit type 1 TsaB [Chloroflexota bacterium]